MVIVGTTFFPPESASDIGRRFVELPPIPAYLTQRGPYIKGTKDNGIQAIEIFELDNSKLAEGYAFVTNRLVSYFGIQGFRYEVNVYYESTEALGLVGLK